LGSEHFSDGSVKRSRIKHKRKKEKFATLLVSVLLISSFAFFMSNTSYGQGGPSWYTKPPYPDYAQSGMPDFDERQSDWWWR
jgi:hypothetical protein